MLFSKQLEAMVPRIHLLYPLTLVRGFWDDVMSQAHSFITSSWTFYLQADDGKVVIFQVLYWLVPIKLTLFGHSIQQMSKVKWSVSQSEPQVRILPHIELDKDSKEEPQKSCKQIRFNAMVLFFLCPKMSSFRANVKCCKKCFTSKVCMHPPSTQIYILGL